MGMSLQIRLFVLGCVLLVSQFAWGTRDSSGPIATQVTVRVVNSTVTNDVGELVKAEKPGFKTVVRNQVELQVQQAARIDIELQVGQASESIEVQADAALLATENATVGAVSENKRIVELPLNGRNYLQLVSLAPNVSTGFAEQGRQPRGRAAFVRAKP
jgi:hypothetical protein